MKKADGSRNPYTTAEVGMGSDYSAEELEFLTAMQEYQRTRKRRFPSFTECLAVLRSLGYRRMAAEAEGPR